MSDRVWTAALYYPSPLWVGVLVLDPISAGGTAIWAGFLLALGFGSVTGFGLLRHPVWVGSGLALLALAIVVPVSYGPAAGAGWLSLAVGVLVGTPFLWLEFAWRERFSPAVRILALQSTLLAGVAFLAARAFPVSPDGNPAAWQFLESLGQAVTNQVGGMAALISGATPGTLPFEEAFDPVAVALGGIALVALVLSWISPRSALGEALPWSWFKFVPSAAPTDGEPAELELRDGQRDALATRTRSTPPETFLSPGFGSLIVAGVGVIVFLALAVVAPAGALLALVVGLAAGLIGIALVLSRRLTPVGGLAG